MAVLPDTATTASLHSASGSPLAVQAAIRLYRMTAAFPASLSAFARHLDQEIAETEDGAEGSRAFTEKRKPVWKLR